MNNRAALLAFVLAAATSASGCSLYFGDGDDAAPDAGCLPYAEVPWAGLRNPWTGECAYPGGGGGGCGAPTDPGAPWYDASWGNCQSQCNALDEASCVTADGCRAIYVDTCNGLMGCTNIVFASCWSTAQDGPVRGGGCVGLPADECSRHDDCSALHALNAAADDAVIPAEFLACLDETAAPPPPPPTACAELDEPACIDMIDGCRTQPDGTVLCADIACEPIYTGSDCTCGAAGVCTCNVWTFTVCRDATP